MTLNECNPFIRSIKPHTVRESTSKTYALNHRLLYYTGGSGTMRIHRTNYPIYKDTAVLYPAGVVYEVIVDTPLSFLTLNFDIENPPHSAIPCHFNLIVSLPFVYNLFNRKIVNSL